MINASANFITAVGEASRQFRAKLLKNGVELDCDIQKIRCYKGSCASELSIGCVYAPYIEATLMRCDVDLDGAELTYQIGLLVGSSYEYITLGKFKVMDPSKGNGSVSFSAIGTLGQIGNNDYTSALTYPASISSVISELQTITGKTINFVGITPGSYTIGAAITGKIRDALGTIAGLYGGFVSEDQNGNIIIAAYNSGSSLSILPFRTQSIPAVRETPYNVTGIHITVTEASEGEEGQPIPEVYFEYGDPIIFQKNEWMTQSFFNQVVSNFVGLSFDLATIDISLGDPRLEPWDTVALTDLQSNTFSIPCFEIVHTFDGGFSTEVIAEVSSSDTTSVRIKGALEKFVERLDSDVFRAKVAAENAEALASQAQTAVSAAQTAASAAETAADRANELLDDMEDAAVKAGTSLTQIYIDAGEAADSARAAAGSANAAQYGLSEVEKVLDVVNWIAEHGSYEIAEETTVIDGRFYFEYDSSTDSYKQTTPLCNPSVQNYYELATGTFSLTEDEEIFANKYYYKREGEEAPYTYRVATQINVSPIEEGWYELSDDTYEASLDTSADTDKLYFNYESGEYIPIAEPSANPHLLGLYVIGDVSEGISHYVSSHVSLDGGGLVIQTDGVSSKVRIDGEGVKLTNEQGSTIATFAESVTLGDRLGMHVILSPGDETTTPKTLPELGFYQGSTRVAYINTKTLHITQARVTTELRIGQFVWQVRDTNRISLTYDPI